MDDLNMKCISCGGRRFILSTEERGNSWVCVKVCKNCGTTIGQNCVSV